MLFSLTVQRKPAWVIATNKSLQFIVLHASEKRRRFKKIIIDPDSSLSYLFPKKRSNTIQGGTIP
ncbi:MAG TPA: hypothetical protein PLK38_03605, partial [Methanoregulaceae archaeon]|nr:hypothetical protein [Methanoregulaceae archaeon]